MILIIFVHYCMTKARASEDVEAWDPSATGRGGTGEGRRKVSLIHLISRSNKKSDDPIQNTIYFPDAGVSAYKLNWPQPSQNVIASVKSVAGLFSVLMVMTVSTSITEKTKFKQVPLVVTENNQRGLLEVVLVGCASYAS